MGERIDFFVFSTKLLSFLNSVSIILYKGISFLCAGLHRAALHESVKCSVYSLASHLLFIKPQLGLFCPGHLCIPLSEAECH